MPACHSSVVRQPRANERSAPAISLESASPSEGDRIPSARLGLIGELRELRSSFGSGTEVVTGALAGDIERLARFVEGLVLRELPPALLHHLALFHRRVALALESDSPDAAANAWVRSLAAWLALAEERSYLVRLEAAVLGTDAEHGPRGASAMIPYSPNRLTVLFVPCFSVMSGVPVNAIRVAFGNASNRLFPRSELCVRCASSIMSKMRGESFTMPKLSADGGLRKRPKASLRDGGSSSTRSMNLWTITMFTSDASVAEMLSKFAVLSIT